MIKIEPQTPMIEMKVVILLLNCSLGILQRGIPKLRMMMEMSSRDAILLVVISLSPWLLGDYRSSRDRR